MRIFLFSLNFFLFAQYYAGSYLKEKKNYNVLKYLLELHLTNPGMFQWEGKVDVFLKSESPSDTFYLDAGQFIKVKDIMVGGRKMFFVHHASLLKIPLALKKDSFCRVCIWFETNPPGAPMAPWDGGYVVRKFPDGNTWAGIACQEEGASLWWPCKDDWDDKADSGALIIVHNIPPSLVAVANGRKFSSKEEEQRGTWKWKVINPIHPYNINITFGPFIHIHDTLFSHITREILSLDYYVLKNDSVKAIRHFQMIKPMLHCLEKYLGPYPFYEDGYKLVHVPYLGMEHQSCIAYGNEFRCGYLGDTNMTGGYAFDFIILHESIHEWFGNSVTASDISEMWIQEALTTWAESWYVACLFGTKEQESYIRGMTYRILNDASMMGDKINGKPGSADMYAKGAQIIQGLRFFLKKNFHFDSLGKSIYLAFRYRNISTQSLLKFLNTHCLHDISDYVLTYLLQAEPPQLQMVRQKNNVYFIAWKKVRKNFFFPIFLSEDKCIFLREGQKIRLKIPEMEKWKSWQKGYFEYVAS